jgi:coatomer subunit beta'
LNNEIQTANLRGSGATCDEQGIADGERIPAPSKDMGSTEVFPQIVKHNNNGRFIVVCGDGEYIIYTSQALRNKAFGPALDFCWSATATGDYAIRESIGRVKIFKNFKEHKSIKAPISSMEGIIGGHCLAVRGPDCVVFYDWTDGMFIRKIDVTPKDLQWNEAGTLCMIVCEETSYVLRFDASAVAAAVEGGAPVGEDGVEGAFELIHEVSDKVATGQWVGDCFLFTNASNRLNYFVGGEIITLCHLDHTMYMLGFLAKEDRVFLMDNALNIVSYRVLQSVLQFQTAVVRGDMDDANACLGAIPESEHSNVARFLEAQGLKDEALAITKDPDQKFDLALELERMEIATELMGEIKEADKDTTDTTSKWKRLGDLALSKGDLELAEKCASASGDMAGLLLLCTTKGDAEGTKRLAELAKSQGKNNVAFLAMYLLGEVEGCIDLLQNTGRIPEAAFMARTYMPSRMSQVVGVWKEDLAKVSTRAAKALADPAEYPNLFPDLETALEVEAYFKANRGALPPAERYPSAKAELELDLIALFKEKKAAAAQAQAEAEAPPPSPPPAAPAAAAEAAAEAPPPAPEPEDNSEAIAAAEAASKAKADAEAAAADAAAAAAAAAAATAAAEKEAAEKQAAEEAAAAQAAEAAAAEAAAAKAAAEAAAASKAAEEAAAAKAAEDEAAAAAEAAAEAEKAKAGADDELGDEDIGDDW